MPASLSLKGWHRFKPKMQQKVISRWMKEVAKSSEAVFRKGMTGPHSGHVARRRDGTIFLRSTPSQFPAVDSGNLLASLRSETTSTEATVGTSMYYSKFLREGTKHMKRRRMADTAIRLGGKQAKPHSRGWVAWTRQKK